MSVSQVTADQETVGQLTVGRMIAGKMTVGQMTVGKMTVGQMLFGQMTNCKMTNGKITFGQMTWSHFFLFVLGHPSSSFIETLTSILFSLFTKPKTFSFFSTENEFLCWVGSTRSFATSCNFADTYFGWFHGDSRLPGCSGHIILTVICIWHLPSRQVILWGLAMSPNGHKVSSLSPATN